MKVADLLAARSRTWAELEQLLRRKVRRRTPEEIDRFAALYRAACADLALADAYQLPPNTVQYLHQLVARSHSQLYRSRGINLSEWWREFLVRTPRRLFDDNALRLAFFLFFGSFFLSYALARTSEQFANAVINYDGTTDGTDSLREMYAQPMADRGFFVDSTMMGMYISNNAGIGMVCFASGLILLGVGGVPMLLFNGVALGASFGFMDTIPQGENFNEFVTAHGPFELTAIVLSAASGMRLGFSLLHTKGMTRMASMRKCGRETTPMIAAGVVLFILAALIEGFISPSGLPFAFKAVVGALSSMMLLFYFVFLGWPWAEASTEIRPHGTWEQSVKAT